MEYNAAINSYVLKKTVTSWKDINIIGNKNVDVQLHVQIYTNF